MLPRAPFRTLTVPSGEQTLPASLTRTLSVPKVHPQRDILAEMGRFGCGLTPFRVFVGLVAANYIVQVPYAVHLYGNHISPSGALLLAATLAWFVVGGWLYSGHRRIGYPILLGFVVAQVLFYLHSLALSLTGGGLLQQLTHARDPIVWLAFFIGDLSFVAALLFLGFLVTHRRPAVD
jgi:hypothetical protein